MSIHAGPVMRVWKGRAIDAPGRKVLYFFFTIWGFDHAVHVVFQATFNNFLTFSLSRYTFCLACVGPVHSNCLFLLLLPPFPYLLQRATRPLLSHIISWKNKYSETQIV